MFYTSEKEILDFEKSMIENIATFFREFGADPTPYFDISKIFYERKTFKSC